MTIKGIFLSSREGMSNGSENRTLAPLDPVGAGVGKLVSSLVMNTMAIKETEKNSPFNYRDCSNRPRQEN